MVFGVIVVTGFQGWMGSVVVSTNLLPGVLTVHMILAFVLIAALIYLYVKTAPGFRAMTSFGIGNTMRYALGVLIVLTLVQVLLGTQVRQQIDVIAKSFGLEQRNMWIAGLNWIFKVHRSFAWLLLLGNAWVVYQLIKYLKHYFAVYRAAIYLGIFVFLATLSGVILAYLNMPKLAQPSHLLLSFLIFGAQTYLFFVLGRKTRIQTVSMSSTQGFQ
jgi:cytochrome c oxidase assembly protein subunit 15